MAQIFTSNQVNHAYVVKSLSKDSSTPVKPTEASSKGATYVGVVKDSATGPVKSMYFMQRGAAGIVRSDMIDLDKIMYINYTPAADMARKPNATVVTLNSEALSDSKLIVGQDYVLRLEFQNPIGMSPDNKYWKFGVVHAIANTTASDFYKKMAKNLVMNMARDPKLVSVYLIKTALSNTNNATYLDEVDANPNQTLSGTYVGIKIVEAPQEWQLGVKQEKPIRFTISNSAITKTVGSEKREVYWINTLDNNGKVMTGGYEATSDVAIYNSDHYEYPSGTTVYLPEGTAIVNSKLAAELEYFSMGERADRYRNVGWPDSIATEYLADSNAANGYDMISIHYAYTGSNHAVQKSEKDLTLIVARTGANDGTTYATTLGELAAEIKGIIEGIVNPEDSRYLTASKLFTDDSYTNGHAAAIAKASDGTLSIEDGGAIG